MPKPTSDVIYARKDLIPSLWQAIDTVAREEIYIERVEAPPLPETEAFQHKLLDQNWPVYYAVDNDQVVGWADITFPLNPRLAHRGFLGMGLLPAYRGQGLGRRLLQAALDHARQIGAEKVELSVYTTNAPAIALYRRCGFNEIGVIRHYRKHKGVYYDALEMECFL